MLPRERLSELHQDAACVAQKGRSAWTAFGAMERGPTGGKSCPVAVLDRSRLVRIARGLERLCLRCVESHAARAARPESWPWP